MGLKFKIRYGELGLPWASSRLEVEERGFPLSHGASPLYGHAHVLSMLVMSAGPEGAVLPAPTAVLPAGPDVTPMGAGL